MEVIRSLAAVQPSPGAAEAVRRIYLAVPEAVERIFGRRPHIARWLIEVQEPGVAGQYHAGNFTVEVDVDQDDELIRWTTMAAADQRAAFAVAVLFHESIHALWPDTDRAGGDDGLFHTLCEGMTELTTEVFYDDFARELCALLGRSPAGLAAPGRTYVALVTACRLVVQRVCAITGSELKPKLRELALWGFDTLDGALAAMSGEIVNTLGLHTWSVFRRARADHAIIEALHAPLAELAGWERSRRGHPADVRLWTERGRRAGELAVQRLDVVLAEYDAGGTERSGGSVRWHRTG